MWITRTLGRNLTWWRVKITSRLTLNFYDLNASTCRLQQRFKVQSAKLDVLFTDCMLIIVFFFKIINNTKFLGLKISKQVTCKSNNFILNKINSVLFIFTYSASRNWHSHSRNSMNFDYGSFYKGSIE